ncbi:MAG: GTP 3',8-cyclase MoaA [Acidobacteria bacterium]|nr:MAG: GTP 3',8-cyclase MoaA [Acidobacteriota bacterium]
MLQDTYNRPLRDLRISVTDRCNYRCTYCMPFDEYAWIPRAEVLTYEETARLAQIFLGLGAEKIRLTGGEPLARKNLEVLIRKIAPLAGLKELCLTTNGAYLAEKAAALKSAGLVRLNVSLDTLEPEKFRRLTKRGELGPVLEGLEEAKRLGFRPIKLNAVIERGVNEEEILPLAEFARARGFAIRYIEYMDVGNANDWNLAKVVSKKQILAALGARFQLREKGRQEPGAPAVDYEYEDGGGEVGIIASVTEPFCGACARARLTADGKLVTCLFADHGHDLKSLVRIGASDEEIRKDIEAVWQARRDRYSEERFVALNASRYQPREHSKMEMIVLGG